MEGNVGVPDLKSQFGEKVYNDFKIRFDHESKDHLAGAAEFSRAR